MRIIVKIKNREVEYKTLDTVLNFMKKEFPSVTEEHWFVEYQDPSGKGIFIRIGERKP